jgi:hypothetical protein
MDLNDLPDDATVTLTVSALRDLLVGLVPAEPVSPSSPILGVRVWWQSHYGGYQVFGIREPRTKDQTRFAERRTEVFDTLDEANLVAREWAGELGVPLWGQAARPVGATD